MAQRPKGNDLLKESSTGQTVLEVSQSVRWNLEKILDSPQHDSAAILTEVNHGVHLDPWLYHARVQ